MLEALRSEVADFVRTQAQTPARHLIRTVCVNLTERWNGLGERLREQYPGLDDRKRFLFPWVCLHGTQPPGLSEALKESMDVRLLQSLAGAGTSVGAASQLIVLADLADVETCGRFELACERVREELEKISTTHAPFYLIGIFRIPDLSREDGQGGLPGDPNSAFFSVFHRIFLIQGRNSEGLLLDEDSQVDLILHLVDFLTRYREAHDSDNQYFEWVQASPAREGFASAVGAYSLAVPIREMLMTVAVRHGARSLAESLVDESNDGRSVFYLNSFLQSNLLLSLETLSESVSRDPEAGLLDPLAGLRAEMGISEEARLARIAQICAGMEEAADKNRRRLSDLLSLRLQECRWSLEDYLESIVNQEPGGLSIARQFAADLLEHLRRMLPEHTSREHPSPKDCIATVRRTLENRPSDLALVGRGLTACVGFSLGAISLPVSFVASLACLIGACALTTGLIGFIRHATGQRLIDQFAQLSLVTRRKWDSMMGRAVSETARAALEPMIPHVRDVVSDLEKACDRVRNIVEHVDQSYQTPLPNSSAIFKVLPVQGTERQRIEADLKTRTNQPAGEYLKSSRERILWRRLASPEAESPNAWEWHLIEQAAICVLPECRPLLDLRAVKLLTGETGLTDQIRDWLASACLPCLVLKPGAAGGDRWCLLSIDPTGDEAWLGPVIDGIRKHISRAGFIKASDPYRLSFTTVLENVRVIDVLSGS